MASVPFNDIEGSRFGKLLVIGRAAELLRKDAWWVCQCECGLSIVSSFSHLNSGHTSSCGCENARQWRGIRAPQYKHGMRHTSEYRIWSLMIDRCTNPKTAKWNRYGGRGIRVSDEFRESFSAWYEHVGSRPSPEHSIDRIDNDGNYERGNLRWATAYQQVHNRGSTRLTQTTDRIDPVAD